MRDGRTNERRTREDRATQPLDAGRLSFAILDGKSTTPQLTTFLQKYQTADEENEKNETCMSERVPKSSSVLPIFFAPLKSHLPSPIPMNCQLSF